MLKQLYIELNTDDLDINILNNVNKGLIKKKHVLAEQIKYLYNINPNNQSLVKHTNIFIEYFDEG